jgi:hypothetical protein
MSYRYTSNELDEKLFQAVVCFVGDFDDIINLISIGATVVVTTQ